jgi:TPR repeat protein
MTKIAISILLLLSLNLSANLVDDGLAEYEKGNASLASEFYTKACKNGDMKGCIKLAILYYTGDGVKENQIKATKLFKKACKQRFSEACYHLGTIYKRGANGIERNYKSSKIYYGLGCVMRHSNSCDQYNLIRGKRDIVGSDINDNNFSYTYSAEIYGG